MRMFRKVILATLMAFTVALQGLHANEDTSAVMLEVIDAYAEVHTGPGRGYPVFYVIEQGEKIEVLTRRPGWYEIRSEGGKTGWTTTKQISRTIQATGEPADLPSVGYGDYVKNSWVTGMSVGQYTKSEKGELEGADAFSVNAGYRFLSWIGSDLEFGRIYGSSQAARYIGANVYLEPFSDWKLSPFLSLGGGKQKRTGQPSQTAFDLEGNYNSTGLGASFYLGRNFVIKGEYRWYSLKSNGETEKLETWRLGFNTFF